jgi:hypothetical protein
MARSTERAVAVDLTCLQSQSLPAFGKHDGCMPIFCCQDTTEHLGMVDKLIFIVERLALCVDVGIP